MKKQFKILCLALMGIAIMSYGCKSSEKDEIQTSTINPRAKNVNQKSNDNTFVLSEEAIEKICGKLQADLLTEIRASSDKHTGTPYNSAKQADCSGMFHRVLNDIREICPGAVLPTLKNARSSRGLAKWYHDNGDFKIIRNPEQSGHLIQPGMVMFYGYSNKPYDLEKITIDELAIRGTGINHVGIVIHIEKENDKVISYRLFHGRTPGKPAEASTLYLKEPNNPDILPYANWKEPWLGIANVLVEN